MTKWSLNLVIFICLFSLNWSWSYNTNVATRRIFWLRPFSTLHTKSCHSSSSMKSIRNDETGRTKSDRRNPSRTVSDKTIYDFVYDIVSWIESDNVSQLKPIDRVQYNQSHHINQQHEEYQLEEKRKLQRTLIASNAKFLLKRLGISRESSMIIMLGSGDLLTINIPERVDELRNETGLRLKTFKEVMERYPTLAVSLLSSEQKTSKSVIMKSLNITELEYDIGVAKCKKQSNNRAGFAFVRNNIKFLISFLKEEIECSQQDLRLLFTYYPIIYTMDLIFIQNRFHYLLHDVGYTKQQLRALLRRGARCIFYDEKRYISLLNFFNSSLGIEKDQFCTMTSDYPRLITAPLATLTAKVDTLKNKSLWNISDKEIGRFVQYAPGILTTPANTTLRLWEYLALELQLPPTLISKIVNRYPGLLRVNVETLASKLNLIVASQLFLLMIEERTKVSSVTYGDSFVYSHVSDKFLASEFDDMVAPAQLSDLIISNMQQLFRNGAALLLSSQAMVTTLSLDRISSRTHSAWTSRVYNTNITTTMSSSTSIPTFDEWTIKMLETLSVKCASIDPGIYLASMAITIFGSIETAERQSTKMLQQWRQLEIDRNHQSSPFPIPLKIYLLNDHKFFNWLSSDKRDLEIKK